MITVAYFLAAGWSVSLVLLGLWLMKETWSESFIAGMVATFVGGPFFALIAALPWLFFSEEQSPVLATLKKGEWTCVASHNDTIMVPIQTGKTTTFVPQTTVICDQYSRIR